MKRSLDPSCLVGSCTGRILVRWPAPRRLSRSRGGTTKKRSLNQQGGHDATEGMELQARTAVRTHQGRASGEGTKRGHCRGDRSSDGEQGTGSVGRGQGELQA